MPKGTRLGPSLLSGLPGHLATDLFTGAKPVRLAADEVLFLADDPGDGCYRIEDGLLKVAMVSRAGNERILAFLGAGAIVGELSVIDSRPRSASVVAVRDHACPVQWYASVWLSSDHRSDTSPTDQALPGPTAATPVSVAA